MFKIAMFGSQESTQSQQVTGFEKAKEGTLKKLGLVAAQYNGIAACAYSLKLFTVHTLLCLTALYMVFSIKISFYILF